MNPVNSSSSSPAPFAVTDDTRCAIDCAAVLTTINFRGTREDRDYFLLLATNLMAKAMQSYGMSQEEARVYLGTIVAYIAPQLRQ